MKTKLLYVLISSEKDIYLEQLYISTFSAKRKMPECKITLITDEDTKATFKGTRAEEIKYVDELIVVPIDKKYTPQQRSRILKTSARLQVEGDFLFIDTDTIINKPLYDIDEIDCELSACRDSHSEFDKNPYRKMCLEHGHMLGWPIEEEKEYFNSGIIYVKDNESTREFYERWNEEWKKGTEAGVNMDQPAFAKTNYHLGHRIKRLDDRWNCELLHGMKYFKDAYIIHYLATSNSDSDKQIFVLKDKAAYKEIKKTGKITKQIEELVDDPYTGLEELTTLVSGKELYLMRSPLFDILKSIQSNPKLFSWVEKYIPKIYFNLVHIFSKCSRK